MPGAPPLPPGLPPQPPALPLPPSPPLPPLAPGIQASFGGIVSLLFTGFVVVLAVGVCKRVADVYQQKKMQRGMTAVDPDETELLRLEDVMPQPQGGVLM